MNFDVVMPLTLFCISLASMFLDKKTEAKLRAVFEEKKFTWKDAVLLVATMVVMVYFIAQVRDVQMILMILYLFAYSMLLFIFTYVFSNKRWYLAIVPSATFIFLYVFFRESWVWSYLLVNVYGAVFAVLITLYLASLFTWKTTLVFTGLLTVVDIILVLATGAMVSAATSVTALRLPVMVSTPIFPEFLIDGKRLYMALGLGDFFFAGLLASQTFRRFGKSFAVLSIIAMATSFFVFEALLLTYGPRPFPGTLMIICGWTPLALWKILKH